MVKISKALSYGDIPSSLRVGSVYDLPFDDKKFDISKFKVMQVLNDLYQDLVSNL